MAVLEFRISNSSSAVVAFCLEPWGGRYRIPGNGVLRVVIEAPTDPVVEWELGEDIHALVVHGPVDAVATVFDGENEVRAE
jgi:hypothetical protein